MSVSPEQAKEYLTDIGYFNKPDLPDATWADVIGFLMAYGFIAEVNFDSPIGETILAIVDDVFEDYQEWKREQPLPDAPVD